MSMIVKTKYFGTVELDDEKLITFQDGLLGLDDYKHFVILYDNEKEEKNDPVVSWLQSADDETFAMPIIDPLRVYPKYNPILEDELLANLGEVTDDSSYAVYVTMTVPQDIEKTTVNLKAPLIINTDTLKACQVVIENDYAIKYNVYKAIQKLKEKAGEPAC